MSASVNGVQIGQKLLTIIEVEKWLGIKKGTIYSWVSDKKIPFTKVGGRLRFETTKIEEFLKNNSH